MKISKYLISILLLLLISINSCKLFDSDDYDSKSSKNITLFSFLKVENPTLPSDVHGTIIGTNISLNASSGTNITSLIATFAATGKSVLVNKTTQVNGKTPNDFSNPVTYTVIAEDGSRKNFLITVVTVVVEERLDSKEITSF
ncbi:MAG: hypothetical protein ABII25_01545, partial [bacterium]